MGSQTVVQVSNFVGGRYFSDEFWSDYSSVPDSILAGTPDQLIDTARQFFASNTWALAAVTSEEKELLTKLYDKLDKLF